jgi:putative membrane protein
MDTLVRRAALALVANAIALIAAAALLDRVSIREVWFLVLVPVFTVISLVVTPLVSSLVKDHAPGAAAFAGLIATYVALLVTDLVADSIQIEGLLTWVLATVIVWAAVLAVQFLAPYVTGEKGGDHPVRR